MLNPEIARGTLLALAAAPGARRRRRGATRSPARSCTSCATGELAASRTDPAHAVLRHASTRRRCSCCSPASYYRWTADLETMTRLRPAFDAALDLDRPTAATATATASSSTSGARRPACATRAGRTPRTPSCTPTARWREGADRARRGPGLRVPREAADRRCLRARSATTSRAAELRAQAAGAARRAFNEAFWMPEEGSSAPGARRRQAAGRERHVQRRALPVLRHRRRRQGARSSPSA